MAHENFQCARCGTPLHSIEAICPHCDTELSALEPDPQAGKYRCPACDGHFNRPTPTLRPRRAPWYRPQFPAVQCPHCSALLHDRKTIHRSARELALVWIAIFAAGFSPWHPFTQLLLAGFYLSIELVRWIRVRSARFAEEDRFTLEPVASRK